MGFLGGGGVSMLKISGPTFNGLIYKRKENIMKETRFIRHLIWAFQLIKEKFPCYYFYLNASFINCFTLNRLGYWFYFLAVIFLYRDQGLSLPFSSFFSPSNMLIRAVLGASLSLALIKGIPSFRKFIEKRLEGGAIDNLVQSSSIDLIINSYKPFFFAIFFHYMFFLTELSQARVYSEKLLNIYGEISVRLDPLGLKRALVELELFLRDDLVRPYFFFFLLFFLVVSILLHYLEEKEKKK